MSLWSEIRSWNGFRKERNRADSALKSEPHDDLAMRMQDGSERAMQSIVDKLTLPNFIKKTHRRKLHSPIFH